MSSNRYRAAANREPVFLNVYDMFWTNEYTGVLGMGVYHSGVQVYNQEYAYGGHPYNCSGIFEIRPKDASELGEQFRFKDTIYIGHTELTRSEVEKIVDNFGEQFEGGQYHLMTKNCNHFTAAFVEVLTGRGIPSWVNRLAYVSSCIPGIGKMLPKEWLTPPGAPSSLLEDGPPGEPSPTPTPTPTPPPPPPPRPNSTQPNSTQPNSTRPNSTRPNSTRPNSTLPDSTLPDSTRPDSTRHTRTSPSPPPPLPPARPATATSAASFRTTRI